MAETHSPSIPSISIVTALNAQVYRVSDPTVPVLSITATLHRASQPITLFSRGSVLNPKLALIQNGFELIDSSTNEPVPQVSVKLKRKAFRWQLGSSDEKYFITLMPGVPHTIQTPFGTIPENNADPDLMTRVQGARGLKVVRYALHVGSQKTGINWWRYGVKEDFLDPPEPVENQKLRLGSEQPSPLVLNHKTVARLLNLRS